MKYLILSLVLLVQAPSSFSAPVDFTRCKEAVNNSMLERSLKFNSISGDFSSLINNFNYNNIHYLSYSQILKDDSYYIFDAYNQISTIFRLYENNKFDNLKNRESTMKFVAVNFNRIKSKSNNIGSILESIKYRPLFREALQLKAEIDKDLDSFRYCY